MEHRTAGESSVQRRLARRDLLKSGAAVAVALALAACGNATGGGNTPAATAGVSATTATGARPTTAPTTASGTASAASASSGGAVSGAFTPPADLVAKAKQEGKVQFYTSLDTQIVDAVIKPFKEKYGIDVQYFRGGSNDVTSKVLAESDAGKVQADVVDASDVASFLVFKKRNLLKVYDSPLAAGIAADLKDPDKQWVACRLTTGLIQYNTTLVTEPPKTWKDLTDPKWSGKLVFFSSSNGDGAPRLYTLSKTFGDDLLKGLAANKPLRVTTPQLITQTLENGERAVGFLQNDNIAQRSKLQGKPTNYLFPAEGVPVEIGAVGIIKDAARPSAATLFYDWWISDEGQKILVEGGKFSSRTGFEPPKGNPPLSTTKLLVQDYTDYEKNRAAALEKLAQIFGGEWGV